MSLVREVVSVWPSRPCPAVLGVGWDSIKTRSVCVHVFRACLKCLYIYVENDRCV